MAIVGADSRPVRAARQPLVRAQTAALRRLMHSVRAAAACGAGTAREP